MKTSHQEIGSLSGVMLEAGHINKVLSKNYRKHTKQNLH